MDEKSGAVVEHPVRHLEPRDGRGFVIGEGARTWIEADRRLARLHDHPDWMALMEALEPAK